MADNIHGGNTSSNTKKNRHRYVPMQVAADVTSKKRSEPSDDYAANTDTVLEVPEPNEPRRRHRHQHSSDGDSSDAETAHMVRRRRVAPSRAVPLSSSRRHANSNHQPDDENDGLTDGLLCCLMVLLALTVFGVAAFVFYRHQTEEYHAHDVEPHSVEALLRRHIDVPTDRNETAL